MFWIDINNHVATICLDNTDEGFESLDGLTNIAESRKWSKQTVTDVWNGFAGTAGPFADLKPWTKCCKNRPYGLQRIWEAIQRLVPAGSGDEAWRPDSYTETAASIVNAIEQSTTPILDEEVKELPKAKQRGKAKVAKPEVKAARKTQRDEVVRLISRVNGASLAEIAEKLGYQLHTVRGMISTLQSKQGLSIESSKHATKGRCYRLVA